MLAERTYVLPDDVQRAAGPVMAHRIEVHGHLSGIPMAALLSIGELLSQTPVPIHS